MKMVVTIWYLLPISVLGWMDVDRIVRITERATLTLESSLETSFMVEFASPRLKKMEKLCTNHTMLHQQ